MFTAAPTWNYLDLLCNQQMQPGIWAATSTTHAVRPPRLQLLFFGLLSSAIDRQNSSPDDARHMPCAVRSLVLSRLDFCNALFGGLNNGQFNRLQRLQNSAARLINRVRRRDHIAPILQLRHWLQIRMRVIFSICTYIFKIMHDLAPACLNCVCALRSACITTLLKVTMSKKTIGQSNFAVTGP